jgi:hypothetical protein
MALILILFFISLLGIIIMLGRKISLLRAGSTPAETETPLPVPNLEKIRESAERNARRYGYLALVALIRLQVRVSNFLKVKWGTLREKIKNALARRKKTNGSARPEVNKFLRMMSDYKEKVRRIKHRVHQEENEEKK